MRVFFLIFFAEMLVGYVNYDYLCRIIKRKRKNRVMKVKEVEIEEIKTEVVNTYEMVNRYYWSSRSVYAVEFEFNIYEHDPDNNWTRMKMIEVQFENNIIRRKDISFCDSRPVIPNKLYRKEWYDELFYAYTQGDKYYDYRTKEQFDTDFNAVIKNLQNMRD